MHNLEGRFDGLEGRFDGLEVRFDRLEDRFDGLEVKLDGLESNLGSVDARVYRVEVLLEDTNSSVKHMEELLSDNLKVKSRVDNHEARLRDIETKQPMIISTISMHSKQLKTL